MGDLLYLFNVNPSGTTLTTGNVKSGVLGDGTAANLVSPGSGSTITSSSDVVQQGTTSAKFDTAATFSGSLRLPFSAASHTSGGFSFYLQTTTLPASTPRAICTLRHSAGRIFTLAITSAGQLQAQNSSLAQFTGGLTTGTALAANTLYRVGVSYVVNSTSSTLTVNVYAGDSTTPLTGKTLTLSAIDLGTNAATLLELSGGTGPLTSYYDTVQLHDGTADEPGAYILPTSVVFPTSLDSNSGAWTATGGTIPGVLADSDNATYMLNPGSVAAESFMVKLGYLDVGNVKIDVPVALDTGQPNGTLKIELLQGTSTVVATWSDLITSTTFTTLSHTLTSGEAALITDRSNLHVRITAN